MKSNVVFDKICEDIINMYEPLAKWYDRNQDTIHYNFPTRSSLNHERQYDNYDVVVLGKMVKGMLSWFEMSNAALSNHAKAFNAASSIMKIYEDEKENLSDEARESYKIENERSMRRIYEREG